MNQERRKKVQAIIDKLNDLKEEIDMLRYAEDDAFEKLPESLQFGKNGERMEEISANLSDAADNIEPVISDLEDAIN